jgi:hypothetical protein
MERFEYRVCQAQQGRMTFADGVWLGEVAQDAADVVAAFESCPQVWDYLNEAGAEGWEMVAATTRVEGAGAVVDVIYLRRRR